MTEIKEVDESNISHEEKKNESSSSLTSSSESQLSSITEE